MERMIVLNMPFTSSTGENTFICPVILEGESESILIEAGVEGFLDFLKEEAGRLSFDLQSLTTVIVTHQDFDHTGGLPEMLARYPKIRVLASRIEKEYLEKRKKFLRLEQSERNLPLLSPAERVEAVAYQEMLKARPPIPVDLTVFEDTDFDCCGGITVIVTPGHMPGHISVYSKKFKAVITGDALTADRGILQSANPAFTLDMALSKKSAAKFLRYDVEQIICYHGGIVTGDVKKRLRELTGQ